MADEISDSVGHQKGILNEEQASRSVLISNITNGITCKQLYIHFQRKKNGGGEIDDLRMLNDGKAILIFDNSKEAESVLTKQQMIGDTVLDMKPYVNETPCNGTIDVFSLVDAKINHQLFDMTPEMMNNILSKIAEETKIKFIELCDGFTISGSFQQVNAACIKLSVYAKHNKSSSTDDHKELQSNSGIVLDVQPKLMQILHKDIDKLKDKYQMVVDHKEDKVTLGPLDGNWELFDDGKEEFITLYQKTSQLMEEKTFGLKADEGNIKQISEEIMKELQVIIECQNQEVYIYGRAEHVEQAMQQLQGLSSRRTKRVNTQHDTTLPSILRHQLESGVTVTVYQGDITKQNLDVIVNAANEDLEHGGGVAGAIVRNGGPEIQYQSRQWVQLYGKVPVGRVAYTGPGHLKCRAIFHAVGPRWSAHCPEQSRTEIFNACFESFRLAAQFGYRSIVLPAISSGIFGVPKDICADMLFTAAESFSCETTSSNTLRDIRFVNIDTETNDAFRKEFIRRYLTDHVNQAPQAINTSYFNNIAGGNYFNQNHTSSENQVKQLQNNENFHNRRSYSDALAHKSKPNPSNGTQQPTRGNIRSNECATAAEKRRQADKELTKEKYQSNEPKKTPTSFEDGYQNRQHETNRSKKENQKEQNQGTSGNYKRGHKCNKHVAKQPAKEEPSSTKESKEVKNDFDEKTEKTPSKSEKHGQDQAFPNNGSKEKSLKKTGKGRGRGIMALRFSNAPGQSIEKKEADLNEKNRASDSDIKKVPLEKAAKGDPGQSNYEMSSEERAVVSNNASTAIPQDTNESDKATLISTNLDQIFSGILPENEKKEVDELSHVSPPGLSVTREGLDLASTCSNSSEEKASSDLDNASTTIPQDTNESDKATLISTNSDQISSGNLPENEKKEADELSHDSPPGLSVTPEGLDLASTCSNSSEEKASSDLKEEADVSMKRKNEENPPQGSPKIRKKNQVPEDAHNPSTTPIEDIKCDKTVSKTNDCKMDESNTVKEKLTVKGSLKAEKEVEHNSPQESHKEKKMNKVLEDANETSKTPIDDINSDETEVNTTTKTTQSGSAEEEIHSTCSNGISEPQDDKKHALKDGSDELPSLRDKSIDSFEVVSKDDISCHDGVNPAEKDILDSSTESIEIIDVTETEIKHNDSATRLENTGHVESTMVESSTVKEKSEVEHKGNEKSDETMEKLTDRLQDLSTDDKLSMQDKKEFQIECCLCKTTIAKTEHQVILSGCGDIICTPCSVKFKDQISKICPTCLKKTGCHDLQPPNGEMKEGIMESSLPGFDDKKTIYIDYRFPAGIQGSGHPNPGREYSSLDRRTFLPDTPESHHIVKMLREAFKAGLLFTVGYCNISKKDNQIVFTEDVEHKHNLKSALDTSGYPDPEYLGRLKNQLEIVLAISSPLPCPSDDDEDI